MSSLFRYLSIAVFALLAPVALAQSLTFRDVLSRPDRPQPDHKIAYGKDPNQYSELWLPAGKGPHPLVVLVHGGCWLSELPGPELVAFLADDLRKHGAAVWSVTYRRLGHAGGGYPGTFLDVASGIDNVRTVAEKYALSLDRVVATGHSAGGHLALWAAARPKIPDDSALKTANPLPIKSVVGIAAVPDLAYATDAIAYACEDKTVANLVDLDKRGKPAAWADTSPAAMLPLGVKQVLVSGIYDNLVPPAFAWRYQAKAAGKDKVELATLDASGHFELVAPWTAPGRKVVDLVLKELK
ncbi:MAG: alpha/beta hydrolase [Betaproteobacteria bacterium]|nr:alpha/beta hydrolase [Betaproteobacteria bacterium]